MPNMISVEFTSPNLENEESNFGFKRRYVNDSLFPLFDLETMFMTYFPVIEDKNKRNRND